MDTKSILQEIFFILRDSQGRSFLDYGLEMITDADTGYIQVNSYDEHDKVTVYTLTAHLTREG